LYVLLDPIALATVETISSSHQQHGGEGGEKGEKERKRREGGKKRGGCNGFSDPNKVAIDRLFSIGCIFFLFCRIFKQSTS